jgi:hypothetical protein
MQKWEYKAIVEPDFRRAEEVANRMGEQGWEAFAAVIWGADAAGTQQSYPPGSHLVWLRRPR